MSAKPATVSKPRTRLEKAVANSPRAAKARAAAGAPKTPALVTASPAVPETAVELVRFANLRRAPENVRHIRADEDITPLADDIAAHGLLQNLIGYRGEDMTLGAGPRTVWIVGGGRRLQALDMLCDDRELIDTDYQVPVLIRPRAQAIELSLSENLAKRDMSPVDECRAFAALMELGSNSPLDLAKRTGFTEKYVKQRLRLAALATDVLEALGKREITLESAMAYASTEDRELQASVFKQQSKSTWEQHSPRRVMADISAAQATTGSPIFKFVGAEIYERDGGTYDDDLFSSAETYSGERRIKDGAILLASAERMIRFQAVRIETELAGEYPACFEGYLLAPNLRVDGYPWKAPAAPKGMVMVDADYSVRADAIWKNIARESVAFKVVIGIDAKGELAYLRDKIFVLKEDSAKVKPVTRGSGSSGYQPPSPEEQEKARRAQEIDLKQWRLGAGSFAGTPFEGRAFWPSNSYGIRPVEATYDPRMQDGRLVTLQIYVTNAEHDAMREEAERRVEEDRAAAAERARAAAEAKLAREEIVAQIMEMVPTPAVIVLGEDAYYLRDDGQWTDDPAAIGETKDLGDFAGIAQLLHSDDEGIAYYASIEAYRATLSAGALSDGDPS